MSDSKVLHCHAPKGLRRPPSLVARCPGGLFLGASLEDLEEGPGHSRRPGPGPGEIREWARGCALQYDCREPLRLFDRQILDWVSYEAVEACLADFLNDTSLSLFEALEAGHAWLILLRDVLAESAREPGGGSPSRALAYFLKQGFAESRRRAVELASRSKGNPATGRQILGLCLYLRGLEGRDPAPLRANWEDLRHLLRLGRLHFPGIEGGVSYGRLRRGLGSGDLPGGGEDWQTARRWMQMLIFRKDPIRNASVQRGWAWLVVLGGLLRWYAAALAVAEPKAERPLAEALRLVERHFALPEDFSGIFLYHRSLEPILHYLSGRMGFPRGVLTAA